jgi:2-iminobutanoate/2-iminopropanoate deaminase
MAAKKKQVIRGRAKATAPKASAPKARRKTAPPALRRTVDPGWTWDDKLPLAQGRQIGGTIYVSGQIAYDSDGKLVGEGDMKAQTRQVFDNIKSILESAGRGLKDIVKINTYITDGSKFMDMLAVRSEIFGNDPPASTAVVVAALAFPALLIEVEAIAITRA